MAPPFSPPFETLASFQDLRDCLAEVGIRHQANPLRQVVDLDVRTSRLTGAMYVRWEIQAPLVQVIQVVATDIPGDRFADIDVALARLNHAMPIAGFGLDDDRGFVYYRVTLQRDHADRVAVAQLMRAIGAVLRHAGDFAHAVHGTIRRPAAAAQGTSTSPHVR